MPHSGTNIILVAIVESSSEGGNGGYVGGSTWFFGSIRVGSQGEE